MLVFSAVIAAAEYFGKQNRHAGQLTWRDGLLVGLAQCLALVPGVSRSGSTISAGLFLGLDRALSARIRLPACHSGGVRLRTVLPSRRLPSGHRGDERDRLQLLVSVVITFVIGYAAISWLLRFLTHHAMYWFVGYRVVLALTIMALLATGVVSAT